MTILLPIECQVMQMLLAGENEALATLRQQMEQAKVSSRRMSGTGFFTNFLIPPEVARVNGRPSFKIGDVNGTALNVKTGLGFLLHVTEGALSMLEGYTYDEPWPNEIRGLVLDYSGGPSRNLKLLL